MKLPRLLGALLAVLLIAGCGRSATPRPADPTLQTYFDGIATQTVDSLRAAVGAAAPGSPAAAYATYLQASTRAATAAGQPVDQAARKADRTSTGFRFCQGSGPSEVCFAFSEITQASGKVSGFSVNGKPIAGRLAIGTAGPVRFAGLDARATFSAAYETTAHDNLLVVLRVTSGPRTGLWAVDASYRPTSGNPTASAHTFGPAELARGSSADYLFTFPGARIGGTVRVSATDADHAGTVAVSVR